MLRRLVAGARRPLGVAQLARRLLHRSTTRRRAASIAATPRRAPVPLLPPPTLLRPDAGPSGSGAPDIARAAGRAPLVAGLGGVHSAEAMAAHTVGMEDALLARQLRLVLIGPPGCGKGTQSERLCAEFGAAHLSTGNMVREEMLAGTPLGRELQRQTDTCVLVSDDLITTMMQERLARLPFGQSWILDGYPRSLQQVNSLAQFLSDRATPLTAVLFLDASTAEVEMRLADRLTHVPSGRTYHPIHRPPLIQGLDDVTGEVLTIRDDDRPERIRQRMQEYRAAIDPIVGAYTEQGALLRVSVDGGSVTSVWDSFIVPLHRRIEKQRNATPSLLPLSPRNSSPY